MWIWNGPQATAEVGKTVKFPGTGTRDQNVTIYQSVDFDLKVDTAHSTLFSDGTYGSVSVIFQSWFTVGGGWNGLPGSAAIQNTTAWQHFSLPLGTVLPVPYQLNRLNISFYSNPPQNALGPVKLWIDNVTIKAPPVNVPAPTLGTVTNVPSPVTKAIQGLNVLEDTTGNAFWDRQSLEFITNHNLSWVGRASSGVTYSFTIVGYPNSQNCEAYMFLVPNAAGNEGGPDWSEPNCIIAELQGGPNNATFSFNIKTNTPNANPALYASLPYSTVYGQWTVKFTSDTSITLIAPDGVTQTNFSISADAAAKFAETTGFNIYLGMQANQADGMNQPVVFGSFAVTGVPSAYSENFLAETSLDTTNVWRMECSQPLAAFILPATGADWVSWTIPDAGFNTQVAPTVVGDAASWNALSGRIVPLWGGRKQLVNNSDVGGNAGYFRLVKRTFTQLQVLLPGEQNAPNTPTGKTGTPDEVYLSQGGNEDVTVNAVDNNYNIVNSSDTIQLTCSTDPLSFMPNNAAMSGGTATFTDLNAVAFGTTGLQTITAADVTPGSTIPTANSSQVLVGN